MTSKAQRAIHDAINDSMARLGIMATVGSIIHECEQGVVVHSVVVIDDNRTQCHVSPQRGVAQHASAQFMMDLFDSIDWADPDPREHSDYNAACDFFTE